MASTDPSQRTPAGNAQALSPAVLVQLHPQGCWPHSIELDRSPCLLNEQVTVSWQGHAHQICCQPGYTHLWVNDQAATNRLLRGGDRIRLGQQVMVYLTGHDLLNHQLSIFYRLASTDALTNTAHHAFWLEAFHRELHLAQRTAQPLSILLLDLDQFAHFNRQHGPYVADQALIMIVEQVKSVLRHGDLMARLSGDKFAILCAHTALHGAMVVAERIRKSISEHSLPMASPDRCASDSLRLSLSIGVAECSVSSSDEPTSFDVQSLATVLRAEAEKYLHTAKRQGGNRVVSCLSPRPLPSLDQPSFRQPSLDQPFTAIPPASHWH